MLRFVQRNRDVKAIIFDCVDRMTRNSFDAYKIQRLIKDYDKHIHFSRAGKVITKDSGSDDEFMMDIEVAAAKKLSNDISIKASRGMQEKAEQGTWPSNAPIGYINDLITKKIKLDEPNAPLIKKLFHKRLEGYSLEQLMNYSVKWGLRTRFDKKIVKSNMVGLLQNPFYYVYFRWKNVLYKGDHPPIISKELFDKVQETFNRAPSRFRINRNNYPFNRLVNCGLCDYAVIGELKKKVYVYYRCGNMKCENRRSYIKQERLDSLLADGLETLTWDPEAY